MACGEKKLEQMAVFLLKEGELDQLKSTFEKANNTIDTALNLVLHSWRQC